MARNWSVADAIRALLSVGVTALVRDAASLIDDAGNTIRVTTDARPAAVEKALTRLERNERLLVIADKASPVLRSVAARHRSLIVATPEAVFANGHVTADEPRQQRFARGPVPYSRFAVARALLSTHTTLTQQQVAHLAGLTQQTASDALRKLQGHSVARTALRGGWRATDRRCLAREIVDTYPGAAGITTYWWGSDALEDQFARLRAAAPEALLSGDLAADRISAWRKPQRVTAYLHSVVDLAGLGFAMADEEEYTLAVTVPRDPTLWATSAAFGRAGVADPVLTAFDVLRSGTTGDEAEAAQKVILTLASPNRSFDALAERLNGEW